MSSPHLGDSRAVVTITIDVDLAAAISVIVGSALHPDFLPPPPDDILVITGAVRASVREDPATVVALNLIGQERSAQVVRPPAARERMVALMRGRRAWTKVEIKGRGAVLDEIFVPRMLATAALVEVVDLDDPRTSPIALWSRHVHPSLWAAAGSAARRTPLSADIALAFSPHLIVLAGRHGSLTVAAATTDLVAAEVVALAVRETMEEDRAGPWEDPLVQRATELQLGVARPEEVLLRPIVAHPSAPSSNALASLLDRMTLRLGISAKPPDA